MPKYEEQIGVKIPGQGYYMVSIEVGPFDTDEQVLARISTRVGTVYNVSGQKFEVVRSDPFKLKKLVVKPEKDDEEEDEKPKVRKTKPPKPPVSEPPPPSERRVQPSDGPQVGERWRPRDPRRIKSFVILAVKKDYVLTDDNREIQLSRFPRYERVAAATSKAS